MTITFPTPIFSTTWEDQSGNRWVRIHLTKLTDQEIIDMIHEGYSIEGIDDPEELFSELTSEYRISHNEEHKNDDPIPVGFGF